MEMLYSSCYRGVKGGIGMVPMLVTRKDVKRWHDRAEELRAIADHVCARECARLCRELADDYELLATKMAVVLLVGVNDER